MSDITNAIKQICEEKNLSYEAVLETIESALAAAYRKDFGEKNQNVKVEFDPETGKSKVYDVKIVVEDMPEIEETVDADGAAKIMPEAEEKEGKELKTQMSPPKADQPRAEKLKIKGEESGIRNQESGKSEAATPGGKKSEIVAAETEIKPEEPAEEVRKFNPKTELQIKDAKLIKKTAKVNDVIRTKLKVPEAYGRMAAQTAKQVIIQKLREAEREMIFSEFKNKEHEVVAGVIQRREGNVVLVDLGKAVGVLPSEEQIMNERYRAGERIKVYVKYVGTTNRGPEIILSRTSDEILKKVFYLEIPEIANGLVEIKAVAREAGHRSKVAVAASGENVDPIGSCVGQRGSRIQTIISELGGEKIDIIEYDENIAKFIAHALSPAKVITVELNQEEKRAVAKVAEDQLSLAIGREGQNVRLAARLTDWKLDIVGEKKEVKAGEKPKAEAEKAETEITPLSPPLSGGINEVEAASGAEVEPVEAAPAVEAGKTAEVKAEPEKVAVEAEAEKTAEVKTEPTPKEETEKTEIEAVPVEPKAEPVVEKPKKEKKSKKKEKEAKEIKLKVETEKKKE